MEIDIIALDIELDEIVFIEVKTRASDKDGHPSQAVNKKKLLSMRKVAKAWLYKHNLANDYRFDIISVIINKSRDKSERVVKIEQFTSVTIFGVWY